jgi:DNA polymerase zeta
VLNLTKSQFKVESVLSRITRPENYIMLSPSRTDVSGMRGLECIALNMEPASDFYTDPVSVLDFQSLYPSLCIAYNYCYSTCLGAVGNIAKDGAMGALASYKIPPHVLKKLKGNVQISPNGMVFLKPQLRQGAVGRFYVH